MPLSARAVGTSTRRFEHAVDARWTMAYAAGLGDCNPCYLDTTRAHVIAHPLFPVCLEWPVLLSARELPGSEEVTPEESARGVHAAHDLHLYKPLRAGETYITQATIVGLRSISPGALQMTRLDTLDASGELVCRTWQQGISRGVAINGGEKQTESPPEWPDDSLGDALAESSVIEIPAGLGNVYTECAQIYNPIHSDRAYALAAGLPDIILHGTATLALAVTGLVDRYLEGDPTRVRRLGGRFSGMVLMPSRLSLRVTRKGPGYLGFAVFNPDDSIAFSHGFLCFDSP